MAYDSRETLALHPCLNHDCDGICTGSKTSHVRFRYTDYDSHCQKCNGRWKITKKYYSGSGVEIVIDRYTNSGAWDGNICQSTGTVDLSLNECCVCKGRLKFDFTDENAIFFGLLNRTSEYFVLERDPDTRQIIRKLDMSGHAGCIKSSKEYMEMDRERSMIKAARSAQSSQRQYNNYNIRMRKRGRPEVSYMAFLRIKEEKLLNDDREDKVKRGKNNGFISTYELECSDEDEITENEISDVGSASRVFDPVDMDEAVDSFELCGQ